MRTTVASRNTATAKPTPSSLMAIIGPRANEPKTNTMITAAAVITRAVDARPFATAEALSCDRSYSSRMRDSRNTS